jgi:hypothetical protein
VSSSLTTTSCKGVAAAVQLVESIDLGSVCIAIERLHLEFHAVGQAEVLACAKRTGPGRNRLVKAEHGKQLSLQD